MRVVHNISSPTAKPGYPSKKHRLELSPTILKPFFRPRLTASHRIRAVRLSPPIRSVYFVVEDEVEVEVVELSVVLFFL